MHNWIRFQRMISSLYFPVLSFRENWLIPFSDNCSVDSVWISRGYVSCCNLSIAVRRNDSQFGRRTFDLSFDVNVSWAREVFLIKILCFLCRHDGLPFLYVYDAGIVSNGFEVLPVSHSNTTQHTSCRQNKMIYFCVVCCEHKVSNSNGEQFEYLL